MRRVVALLLCLVLCLSLTSCGSSGDGDMALVGGASYVDGFNGASVASDVSENFNDYGSFSDDSITETVGEVNSIEQNISKNSRKLIKSYDFDCETLEYDAFLDWLGEYVDEMNGYAESMSEDSWNDGARHVYATVRIPEQNLSEFVSEFELHCNVRSKTVDVDDITLEYSDVEGRLSSLRTEMDRLNELLGEAVDLEQVLMLEDRLAVVRGELESYERMVRSMDNQVEYATVTMRVSEVVEYTEPVPERWWDRALEGIVENFDGVIVFFQELALFAFVHLPQLGVLLLIVLVVLLFTRKARMRAKERRLANKRAIEEFREAQMSMAGPGEGTDDKN